jgi:N-hydroxyarylamine O-acetyltransferase
MDLDAYLKRIGWAGLVRPDCPTLQGLARHHTASIAFENLNPLLGWPVSLDSAALERKLVGEGRGGYCYEQNLLFAEALRCIGFDVSGLAARVLWMRPDDALTPRSHMLLRVELDGSSWLADVGFGNLTLSGALRLQADIEQPTAHEPFRLSAADNEWRMQAQVQKAWKTLYRFDLQRQFPLDYAAANYYQSTHADSLHPQPDRCPRHAGAAPDLAEPRVRRASRGWRHADANVCETPRNSRCAARRVSADAAARCSARAATARAAGLTAPCA